MQFIGQYWRGEKPLWKAFWLWGGLFFILLQIVISIVLIIFLAVSLMSVAFTLISSAMMMPYTIWVMTAIWRCANNSKTVWKVLARISVVLGVIFMVFNIVGIVTGILASSSNVFVEDTAQMNTKTWVVEEESNPIPQANMPVSSRIEGNTEVEMRVVSMMDSYNQTKFSVNDEDKRFLIENWQEAMSLATKALFSPDEEQGMGAAYIFLDLGESFIPMFEEKMKDKALPASVRVRIQWVLINMHTENDKAAYAEYEIH